MALGFVLLRAALPSLLAGARAPGPLRRFAAASSSSSSDGAAAARARGAARVSRSTATQDDVVHGIDTFDERRALLDERLLGLGVDPADLESDARLFGSSAMRTYRSFVLPKNAAALAIASMPQRSATVAAQVAFLVREARASHAAHYLRNHDHDADETAARRRTTYPLVAVLDDVRSAHNVGNVFRSCEAAQAAVRTCGITPAPPNAALLKAAVGAASMVEHAHTGSALEAVAQLKERGYEVWAAETTADAVPYYDAPVPPGPLAVVFGNEVTGVGVDVLAAADRVVTVPQYGTKNSLNVGVCASVVLFDVVRRWEEGARAQEKLL